MNTKKKEYQRKYNFEHKDQLREYHRQYYLEHKKENQEYYKEYREKNREKIKAYHRQHYLKNIGGWQERNRQRTIRFHTDPEFAEKRKSEGRESYERRRLKVLSHYSNGKLSCVQCGFSDIRALNIDHIVANGTQNGKPLGGTNLIIYLIRNNYPNGFQVLCSNCNAIKELERRRKDGRQIHS